MVYKLDIVKKWGKFFDFTEKTGYRKKRDTS